MDVLSIIEGVVGREGRYSNNPDDLGGETMWGVTAKVARKHDYTGPMKDMPREVAVRIFIMEYVNEPGYNKVMTVSERIAEEMVDSGINIGTSFPGVWLQRTLNAMNNKGAHWPDIEADGKIGPATISVLKAMLAKRGKDGETVVWRTLNCLQGARYLEITEKREANETFFYGWMLNRVGV